jgi:uncharacterized protein YndB with AHSA1/START domain
VQQKNAMRKENFHIEYVFDNASRSSLWNRIGTAAGLSGWFADTVTNVDKVFTFTWKNHSMEAREIGINPNNFIRFHWLEDENPDTFFEFRLHKNELTGGLMLEITDFIEPEEKDDSIHLWNKQIKDLKRILGL